jgi:hypothetical protein
MNKKNLAKLALCGITSGLLVSATGTTSTTGTKDTTVKSDAKQDSSDAYQRGNITFHEMTESELVLQLNAEGQATYNKLSPEGKALALKVASSSCTGENPCAGLNACKTDSNDCAGKGKCKGFGKCSIADKNLAVKLVADKMAKKRESATK